jgi:hypothetical protein
LSDFLSSKQQSFLLAQDLLQCKDEETLVNRISSEDRGTSAAALWMLLLLRLAAVTTDDRLELRNSKIVPIHPPLMLTPVRCYSDPVADIRRLW